MTPAAAILTAPSADPTSPDAETFFRRAFVITLLVKLALAVVVPFTTDEAYFVVWGKHLDYGYYDHGAMTGWWLWFMLLFGDSAWWLRMPAVVVSQFTGWMLWRMLRPLDATKAGWAAALYLLSPVSLFSFLITTDTPLLFFSVVAVWLTFRGVQRERLPDFFGAGLALGFAFLSKYFAVLLGVSLAVLLLAGLRRPRPVALLVLLAGIIPGVGINIAWNHHHWWVNVLFNLVTRQERAGLSLTSPLIYLAILALLAGPGVIRACVRRREQERIPFRAAWPKLRADGTIVFLAVFLVPLTVFFLVSFRSTVGAHWLLSFFPFLAAVLFAFFTAEGLRRMIRPTAIYTAVPTTLALILPFLPVEWAHRHKSAFSIVMAAQPQDVLAELAPYAAQYQLTTPSYAKSALLGFHAGHHVPVLGPGSFHARQDDLITDLRTFDGRDLMIVSDDPRDLTRSETWFAQSEIKEHTVRGARMVVRLGVGFNYATYREEVLRGVAERFYRMPAWLERFAAPCFFTERYGDFPTAPTSP